MDTFAETCSSPMHTVITKQCQRESKAPARIDNDTINFFYWLLVLLNISTPILARTLVRFFFEDKSNHTRTETEIVKALPVELPNAIDVHDLCVPFEIVLYKNQKCLKVT